MGMTKENYNIYKSKFAILKVYVAQWDIFIKTRPKYYIKMNQNLNFFFCDDCHLDLSMI